MLDISFLLDSFLFEPVPFAITVLVIVVLVIVVSRVQQQLSIARWTTLANRLGLHYAPGGLWKLGEVEGTLEGRRVSLHTVRRSSSSNKDKTRAYYTSVQSKLARPLPFRLEIRREGLGQKLGKLVGEVEIETGDAAFDDAFLVQGDDLEGVLRVLTPEVRQRLLAYSQRVGPVELRQDGMTWEVSGACTDVERLEAAFREQALVLAALEQVHADAPPPPATGAAEEHAAPEPAHAAEAGLAGKKGPR